MPELRCGVITCAHNKMNYCDLDGIEVMGSSAKNPEETSCGSFVEKKGESHSNDMRNATETSNIVCHACECKYNDSHKCNAGKISVAGTNASHCNETECSTFKKEK